MNVGSVGFSSKPPYPPHLKTPGARPSAGPAIKPSDEPSFRPKRSGRSHRLRRSFRASGGALIGLALFALAGAGGATTVKAGSISTLFDSNRSGTVNGAVLFDLTVGPRDIRITGLKMNAGLSNESKDRVSSFSLIKLPTSKIETLKDLTSFPRTAGRLTVPGTANGLNQRSVATLLPSKDRKDSEDLVLKAGKSYALMLLLSDKAYHRYTVVKAGDRRLSYENADLKLSFGSAFDSSPKDELKITPRAVWNGEIQYTVSSVPLPAAAWLFLSALGALGLAGWRKRRPAV